MLIYGNYTNNVSTHSEPLEAMGNKIIQVALTIITS